MKIADLEDLAFSSVALSDIPETFVGKVNAFRFEKDIRERDCLYLDIEAKDCGSFTEKYSSLHIAELVKRMKEAGIDDTAGLEGVWYEWETIQFKIGFPRHFPNLNKKVGVK